MTLYLSVSAERVTIYFVGEVEAAFKNFLASKDLSSKEAQLQDDLFEILRRPKYMTLDDEPKTELRSVSLNSTWY